MKIFYSLLLICCPIFQAAGSTLDAGSSAASISRGTKTEIVNDSVSDSFNILAFIPDFNVEDQFDYLHTQRHIRVACGPSNAYNDWIVTYFRTKQLDENLREKLEARHVTLCLKYLASNLKAAITFVHGKESKAMQFALEWMKILARHLEYKLARKVSDWKDVKNILIPLLSNDNFMLTDENRRELEKDGEKESNLRRRDNNDVVESRKDVELEKEYAALKKKLDKVSPKKSIKEALNDSAESVNVCGLVLLRFEYLYRATQGLIKNYSQSPAIVRFVETNCCREAQPTLYSMLLVTNLCRAIQSGDFNIESQTTTTK